jgi:transcriptional regulator with XRE-family HTH domain
MVTCDYRTVVVCSEIAIVKNEAILQAFGAHLRQLREQRGWSQQVLADVADVSKPTIYRIETARYSATLDVLASIAQGLGVSLGELVTFPPETTAAGKTAISN